MFKISDEIKRKLKENAFHLDNCNGILSNLSGELFEIKFTMQGDYHRFKEFIEKNTPFILSEMYNETRFGYMYYIATDIEYAKESMHRFYVQIFQNRILFNLVSRKQSVEPFCRLFESIKNKVDPNAELWLCEKEKLI